MIIVTERFKVPEDWYSIDDESILYQISGVFSNGLPFCYDVLDRTSMGQATLIKWPLDLDADTKRRIERQTTKRVRAMAKYRISCAKREKEYEAKRQKKTG